MKKRLAILLSTTLFASGCVPLYPAEFGPRHLFQPLLQADLARFQHQLTIDHHRGLADAWTEAGQALLDLASCTPIKPATPLLSAQPSAHLLHQLATIEEARRLRFISQARHLQQRSWHHNTVLVQFTSRSFFTRDPAPIDNDLIRWPNPKDTWQDEWPAPTTVPYHCEELGELANKPLPHYLLTEWKQTERALQLCDDPAIPDHLQDLARTNLILHRADLALLIIDPKTGDPTDHQALAIAETSIAELQSLAPLTADDEALAIAQSLRLSALAIALDEPDLTVDALLPLLKHPDQTVANTARYLLVRTAWTQGWWELVAHNAQPLPPKSSPLHNTQAYFAATAHLYLNHDDRFLAIARQTLQDRPRNTQDPFLGALYRETLQFLARFDVDERTEELLEEFGPRSHLAERQKELATVALDLGRPQVARTLILPLLNTTTDARQLPALHAILALASFLEDDRPNFIRHIDAIANRPKWTDELIPRGRRAAFFAHQDQELAKVLRATLPLMAEWGDDDHAHALRQLWLELIVQTTQRFLRWAPESVVSDDLNALYRLASQLLDDNARGYASKIGADHPTTSALILGTVGLPALPPLEDAPAPRHRWAPLNSLLLIPADQTPPTRFVSQITAADLEEPR